MPSPTKPTVGATTLIGLALALAACGSRPVPGQFDGSVTNPFSATYVCQHTCTPDPGPAPMTAADCASAEVGLEFYDPPIWTFDGALAPTMYSYTDNTAPIVNFVDTSDSACKPPSFSNCNRKTYEPPTEVMARCGDPGNGVIHVLGGPFLGWGGGIGIAMWHFNGGTAPATASNSILDLSQWEGVSFWARRGPDSNAGIRVLVGDWNTDDDISYLTYRDDPTAPRRCERVRECACTNHMPCTDFDTATEVDVPSVYNRACAPAHKPPGGNPPTMSFCGPPHPLTSAGVAASTYVSCNSCGRPDVAGSPPNPKNRCDEPYPAFDADYPDPLGMAVNVNTEAQGDRQFIHKPCMPFSYRNGTTSAFCYDPSAGETVAETSEQCGDHWTTPVNLTNDWRLYLVPFNSMTQQGWAKRFAGLDVAHVSVVRFTWDGGWIDYYIDNVRFYRRQRDAGPPAP